MGKNRFVFDTDEVLDALNDGVQKDYNPDQPRDDAGRWTDGGAGTGSGQYGGGAELGRSIQDDLDAEEGYSPWPRHHEVEEPSGPLSGAQFASPSITDKDFSQASDALNSERQVTFGRASSEIDSALGMAGVTHSDVVGAWADGAENSTMAEIRQPSSPEALRLSAAMKGALGNQKAVLVFQTNSSGPDSLYQLSLHGEPADVHAALLKADIPFHTLSRAPGYQGDTIVTVVDQGGGLRQKIGDFAEAHQTAALEYNGHAEFLGDTQGTGSDAEQRSRAQDAYAKVIGEATSRYQGRSAGEVWQGVRDRWSKQIETLKRAYRSFSDRLAERREQFY